MTGHLGNNQGFSARDLLILLAKLAVTVALVVFILSRQSLSEIQEALAHPRWGWLLASLAVYSVSAVGGAVQWTWILKAAGIRAPGREIRRLYFIGLFFNNFLPANIGGDAYKIVDLGRRENRSLGVFASTLLDRLIGLTALTFLAVIFLTIASVFGYPLPTSALMLIPTTAALVIFLALLLSRRLGKWLPGIFFKLGLPGLGRWFANVTDEFALFRPRVRWLNGIFAFSLLVQLLRMVTHLLVVLGLGFSLGVDQMVQLLVLIPMLALLLILPITINGIGLRENLAATLLVWCGLAASQVVAVELVAYLVQVVFSLQGGVLLWLGRWGRRPPDSQD